MTVKQKQLMLAWFSLLDPREADGIWGPQSAEATRKLQVRLGIPADGIFGKNTKMKAIQAMEDGLKQEVEPDIDDFWNTIRYFTPEEFACKCGEYCNGYPHSIQPVLVQIAQRAREYFHKPITIVSGLRCQTHNANVGGVANSQHMYGEAADVYVHGVDPQEALQWFQNQGDVRYTYRIAGSSNIHYDIAKGAR